MPQSLNQKVVNNFIRGLITESGEMTFPDGASVDELNCDLRRDGTRRRRLAVHYESNNALSSFTLSDNELVSTGSWINVGGNADLEFLVLQKGSTLYFYNKGGLPYSAQVESDTVNLVTYEHAGSAGAENVKCQFASIKGNLVVSSPAINTIVVEYDSVAGTFSETQISFKTRDFEYQGDTEDYFTVGASSLSGVDLDTRVYDTLNSGWADDNNGRTGTALTYYRTQDSNQYPALTHPWFSGKDSSDNQSVPEWKKIAAGTSLSGSGRYILDFFNKDRASAITGSGFTITNIPTETETSRFRCVESFSGRVFYAGLESSKNAGTILFSKLVEATSDLGKCHQINDPTAEYASDLLATDGGEIKIPDAVKIQKLYAFQNSLFVFAENGVWQITGVDGVFKADAYAINRVTRVGILSPETFVEAEGAPFWWSRFGIHTLGTDSVSGQGQEQNLTIPTIQSFWDGIDLDSKLKVTGVYDSINKRIYWAYPNEDETVESKLNNFLILDIPLQAFYPWKVSDQASNTDAIVGLAFYSGFGATNLELDVTSNSGADDVVTSAGDDVVSTQISTFTTGNPAIVLICRNGADNKITFGGFTGTDFLDWEDTNYTSFAETGYDFIGDAVTKKNAPMLITYCRLTEEGFTGTELDGYEAIRPSSLLVSSAWDFRETFSTGQQVYLKKFPVVPDPNNLDTYDYPHEVITSRVKIRGHGRSMRLKYESEQGKDFVLIGWGMVQGRNPRP